MSVLSKVPYRISLDTSKRNMSQVVRVSCSDAERRKCRRGRATLYLKGKLRRPEAYFCYGIQVTAICKCFVQRDGKFLIFLLNISGIRYHALHKL